MTFHHRVFYRILTNDGNTGCMNNAFYTYGNKELITQKSFSVIPAKAKPILQPLVSSLVENMLGVKELRTHLHHFEKIYNLEENVSFKSRIKEQTPLTPAKIRKIRKMLKMTQFQFGNLLGISKTTVSYWENGHLHPCRENRKILHTLASYGIVGLRKIEEGYNTRR